MLSTIERREAIDEMMRARRSVRAYRPDPIPHDVLERIFATAQLAPSNCNVQPWEMHVLSGAATDRMRRALHDAASSGAALSLDVPRSGGYPGEYRVRQIEAAKALFSATGVAREDVAARTESFLRNFLFFDAPHAAFLFIPGWAGMREAADCGMYAQSLMLTLTAYGYASCAQGALSHYAEIVRQALGVSPDMRLLFGLSFGIADEDHPSDRARTVRAALDQSTRFHD